MNQHGTFCTTTTTGCLGFHLSSEMTQSFVAKENEIGASF